MKKLGFKELYLDVGVYDHYPIKRFAELLPTYFKELTEYSLDFSGIEQITDEVFFAMQTVLSESQSESIVELDLTGCIHLKDRGIHLLAKSFIGLQKINLTGCKRLTERSLFYLKSRCVKLEEVIMDNTQLAVVPRNLGSLRLSYENCPIYLNMATDSRSSMQIKESVNRSVNLVILALSGVNIDVAHKLLTGEDKPLEKTKQHITFKENALKISDTDINIIELHCTEAFYSLFIDECSIFMIAVPMEKDKIKQIEVIKAIDFIRGVVHQAPITVLCLVTEETVPEMEQLNNILKSIFQEQTINMSEHLEKEHYAKSVEKDFPHQWRYVQSLEANRIQNFPISLVGLPWLHSESLTDWKYYSAIREVDAIEKATAKWQEKEMIGAKESLDRVNKADISEFRSLTNPTEQIITVSHSVLILLEEPIVDNPYTTLKKVLGDANILRRLQDYQQTISSRDIQKLVQKLDEIVSSKEDVDKINQQSKLGSALWNWVKAEWTFMHQIGPLLIQLEKEKKTNSARDEAPNSLSMLHLQLAKNLSDLHQYMYQWIPKATDSCLDDLLASIPVEKGIISIKELMASFPKPFFDGSIAICSKALHFLSTTGKLIYFSNHPKKLIVTNIQWFCDALRAFLNEWTGPENNDLVWCLGRCVPLSTKSELAELLQGTIHAEQWPNFVSLLMNMGLAGTAISCTTKTDGAVRNRSYEDSNGNLIYGWHKITYDPCIREGIGPENTVYKRRAFMLKYFPEFNSNHYNHTEYNFKFSFKFRIGMPSNLFPKILTAFMERWKVLAVWQQGIFLRTGAVDVIIRHNFHGTMASSSIDMEIRTNRQVGNTYFLQEYMWSVISKYVTVIEATLEFFPFMHHKLRYYCRGECDTVLGKENTFSPCEIDFALTRNLSCNKCSKYQMDGLEWRFLVGRQFFFPMHDFDGPSCKNCWSWTTENLDLWKMQCQIYPSFVNFGFRPTYPDGPLLGNILYSLSNTEEGCPHSSSIESLQPLSQLGFKSLSLHVFDPSDVTMTVYAADCNSTVLSLDFATGKITLDPDRAVLPSETSPKEASDGRTSAEAEVELEKDEVITSVASEQVPFVRGNVLELRVSMGEVITDRDGYEIKHNTLTLKIKHTLIKKVLIPAGCHLRLTVMNKTAKMIPKLMLKSTTFPVISARYFRPGMIVVYKIGVGTRWNPGVVNRITNGQLHVLDMELFSPKDGDNTADTGSSVSSTGRLFSPDSEDLCPVALYPEEINAIVDKRQLKGVESWYKFLDQYPHFQRAPFGLFPRLAHNDKYVPLPRFQNESRVCPSSGHNPHAYIRSFYESRTATNINPMLILPQSLTFDFIYSSPRELLQNSEKQAIYLLCKGQVWMNNYRDMHMLNKPPHNLSKVESEGIWSEFLLDLLLILRSVTTQRVENFVMQFNEINQCFPEIDPNINREQLVIGIVSILKVSRDVLLLRQVLRMPPNLSGGILCRTDVKIDHLPMIQSLTASLPVNEAEAAEKHLQQRSPGDDLGPGQRKFSRRLSTVVQKQISEGTIASPKEGATPRRSRRRMQSNLAFGPLQAVVAIIQAESQVCESHNLVKDAHLHDNLGPYPNCIGHVRLGHKKIDMEQFPSQGILNCSNLCQVELTNCRIKSLGWIRQLRSLVALTIPQNLIEHLTDELLQTSQKTLRFLNVACNPLTELPDWLCEMSALTALTAGDTMISRLPENIGQLSDLRSLDLDRTCISSLPDSFIKLKKLNYLKLTGLIDPMSKKKYSRNDMLSLENWEKFTRDHRSHGFGFTRYSKEELAELFLQFDIDNTNVLTDDELTNFTEHIFEVFPRMCMEEDVEFPKEILGCSNLRTLCLSYQGIKNVPDEIRQLKSLTKLILDYCPYLETISGQIVKTSIEVLSLKECNSLRTPPKEIRSQGMNATVAYLKRLAMGSIACHRTKLMFVGLGGAGKTSLMRALMTDGHRSKHLDGESITDGIDINSWTIRRADEPPITYSVWDFAGQTLYYNTHQFFITNRAVYLLVWNIRQGYEHAGLQFWLSSITCHAPKAPIFVVGTHADKVSKMEVPTEEILKRYPSIVKFCSVSSATGEGVEDLLEEIISITKQQPYIGENIPEAWLTFEQAIVGQRNKKDYLAWNEVEKLAKGNAIYGAEVNQVVRLLHDLGSIQFFDSDLLRDNVIINSQWLVDVMACVVTVRNDVIKDGRLHHNNIAEVWKSYNSDVHEWLLRLTEIFDLTFPLVESPVNIVPCLLPPAQPDFIWEEPHLLTGDIREARMLYFFDYLPAGLFNRAQVRLCQFSDSSIIWQRGSLLQKNDHKAIVCRERDRRVVVKVQGLRPENILLMVHEVIESLIEEAFSGVNYEYMLPCSKCGREQIADPQLFSSKMLRRAIEMKIMFLQCHIQFHCISIGELQSIMPPESVTDYDMQFERSMGDLLAAEQSLTTNVMMIFAEEDLPKISDEGEQQAWILDPKTLSEDLKKNGISVWFSNNLEGEDLNDLITAMTRTHIVLHHMSSNFVANQRCRELFDISRDVVQKPIRLVIVGEGKDWQTSDIGMKITGDRYFNFQRQHQYEQKVLDLSADITAAVGTPVEQVGLQAAKVFLSYCWDNSQMACDNGDCKVRKDSAIGYGDPRQIKEFLESLGIVCWLDVERIGASSLYAEICNGLIAADVVIAFVSDEYADSDTCRKEFLFAQRTLNRPIILVQVGKGNAWELSEIGFSALDYPKVNFQVTNENSHELLAVLVKNKLDEVAELTPTKKVLGNLDPKQEIQRQAFQEQYELVQRKLFRLLSNYAGDSTTYPRVVVIDFFDPEQMVRHEDEDERMLMEIGLEEEEALSTEFCFKLLCEFDGGWHSVHCGYPIDLDDEQMKHLLSLAAPYLARVSKILTYTNCDLEFVQNVVEGKRILDNLEKDAKDWGRVKPVYEAIRDHVKSRDLGDIKGNLKKCHLPSGKLLWLCKKHRSLPRTTIVSEDQFVSVANSPAPRDNITDEQLISTLEKVHLEADNIKSAETAPLEEPVSQSAGVNLPRASVVAAANRNNRPRTGKRLASRMSTQSQNTADDHQPQAGTPSPKKESLPPLPIVERTERVDTVTPRQTLLRSTEARLASKEVADTAVQQLENRKRLVRSMSAPPNGVRNYSNACVIM